MSSPNLQYALVIIVINSLNFSDHYHKLSQGRTVGWARTCSVHATLFITNYYKSALYVGRGHVVYTLQYYSSMLFTDESFWSCSQLFGTNTVFDK